MYILCIIVKFLCIIVKLTFLRSLKDRYEKVHHNIKSLFSICTKVSMISSMFFKNGICTSAILVFKQLNVA